MRFVREGKFDEDILRMVLGNVRMPDKVRGDLLAQHNANLVASVRLAKLFSSYGTDLVDRAYEAILDRSESTCARLRPMPAGTYSFEDQLDDYGPGRLQSGWRSTSPSTARVRSEFDFSRSSDPCRRR